MSKTNATISIEVPSLDAEEIREAVVDQIARDMLYKNMTDPEDPSDQYEVKASFQREIHKAVEEKLKEQVRGLVPDLVKHILDEQVIRYDKYGERGDTTTMKEVIAKEFQDVARHTYRGNGRQQQTGFEEIIRATVKAEIADAIKGIVEEHLEPVRESIQEELGAVTAAALEKSLKLHGSVDEKGRRG